MTLTIPSVTDLILAVLLPVQMLKFSVGIKANKRCSAGFAAPLRITKNTYHVTQSAGCPRNEHVILTGPLVSDTATRISIDCSGMKPGLSRVGNYRENRTLDSGNEAREKVSVTYLCFFRFAVKSNTCCLFSQSPFVVFKALLVGENG